MTSLRLDRSLHHFGWDHSLEPAVSIRSGSSFTVDVVDASAGQITSRSDAASIGAMDFERVNPVSGPIFVEGARPGDVLQVDLLAFEPGDFGWTALIPGFGLLSSEFPDPWLHLWRIADGVAHYRRGLTVPVRPMCGVIGVAPAEAGVHSVVPPRRVGGNLDIPQLGAGATVYLPIEVEGALFGIGDTHAAQGDGEVCGTGIESAMSVSVRLTVRRDVSISSPEFDIPDMALREQGPFHACTGIGPDLMVAAQDATRSMISYASRTLGLDEQEAYALCSVAGNLRISEVVDSPNWVVTMFLPDLRDHREVGSA